MQKSDNSAQKSKLFLIVKQKIKLAHFAAYFKIHKKTSIKRRNARKNEKEKNYAKEIEMSFGRM
jgi:hypothetical protein